MSRADGLRAHVVVPREHFSVDVSLHVEPGETVAVMGPSGAGKSTLLQALAGLEPLGAARSPSRARGRQGRGSACADRSDAARCRAARAEAPALPHLSVRENVAFGPRAAGVEVRAARAGADDWLARVGLPGSAERMPHELSGGEQQRVAVARALAASPRVVLLDEPLVALDPETAGDIRRMLRDQLVSTTTVAVTHDAADAVALADRLLVVEEGRVTQAGAVREVLAAPASGFVASIAGVNRLVGVASGGAWRSRDVLLTSADPASRALAATDGAALAAVFRPGDVRVAEAGAESWTAAVTRIEPTLGGVRVHTDAGEVDLSLDAAAGLAVGDRIRLRVDPGLVRFVGVGVGVGVGDA